jgi:flavin-dependent dehydrogenase
LWTLKANWIPHELRRATEGGVFFCGDPAGHCLPLTAEGIRTALYFGVALGRELRAVLEGGKTPERAIADYAAFNDSHEWIFLDAARPAAPAAPARPPPARGDPGLLEPAFHRLVLRALPADRPA